MSETMKLKITASTDSSSERTLVPINTDNFLDLDSSIGQFKISINIKDFKGSDEYNETNSKYDSSVDNNLMIRIEFRPTKEINGDDLIFGNDFDSPIKDYLPYGTSMGLKAFSKFVDPSCTYDLYSDKPWIYGKCLSSFNTINVSLEKNEEQQTEVDQDNNTTAEQEENTMDFTENIGSLKTLENEDVEIPKDAKKRQSYFTSVEHCKNYTFLPGVIYRFEFSNSYLSLKDNNLAIVLPGGFQVNLANYLNKNIEKTCNFVLKKGNYGLIIKFQYV